MIKKVVEAKEALEPKVEKKVEPKVVKFEDLNLSACVNLVKAKRAFKGVYGGAKAGSVELELANKLRTENPSLKGKELVIEVYKGLFGFLDVAKAKINRENEAKEAKRKASK